MGDNLDQSLPRKPLFAIELQIRGEKATLFFFENEEEEAVCHAFCDKYNLPNTVYSHLVSQVTAMHQQFLQTEEEEESEWEEEDESYEEEEVEEDSESDAPLPQKPLQQPDADGEIINPFTPPPPPVPTKSSPQTKKTEAEIREAIERLTRQGEEIRDKREQAAREKEKNETPKTKQITEKEKKKIVNKLYEDAKRRNEEQRKKEEEKRRQQEEEEAKLEKEVKKKYGKATQRNYVHYKELAEPKHVVEGRVYGETDDQPPHPECTFRPTIRKKSQNLASTHRTLAEEEGPVTTRLYKDAMKRKESQSALEEDTPQFKDSLRGSSRVGGRTIRSAHSSDRMNDTTHTFGTANEQSKPSPHSSPKKKFENVRTTHRDFSQESFPQLKRGTLEAQEVRTRSDHTTQISQELTEKMEKEIAQLKYLEGTKKNRKERLDNERDEKEQPKQTFRKRIVLPSDEVSPKKVTLEQNRIDSLTARLYRESETIEKRRMERARVLDHEAKEQSKTARPDKKSLKIVEQKQRKRIDEVFLHLISGLREWKSENVGSPNLPDDEENHTIPQKNQETEAILNVTELGVIISLSQPSAPIRKWKNLNKPHFETSALSPTLPTRIEDASSPYFTTQNLSTPKTELSGTDSFEPFPQQSPLSGTGKTSFLSLASLDAVHRIRNSIAFSTDLESTKDVDAKLNENEEPPFGLSLPVWEGVIHLVAFILEEQLRFREENAGSAENLQPNSENTKNDQNAPNTISSPSPTQQTDVLVSASEWRNLGNHLCSLTPSNPRQGQFEASRGHSFLSSHSWTPEGKLGKLREETAAVWNVSVPLLREKREEKESVPDTNCFRPTISKKSAILADEMLKREWEEMRRMNEEENEADATKDEQAPKVEQTAQSQKTLSFEERQLLYERMRWKKMGELEREVEREKSEVLRFRPQLDEEGNKKWMEKRKERLREEERRKMEEMRKEEEREEGSNETGRKEGEREESQQNEEAMTAEQSGEADASVNDEREEEERQLESEVDEFDKHEKRRSEPEHTQHTQSTSPTTAKNDSPKSSVRKAHSQKTVHPVEPRLPKENMSYSAWFEMRRKENESVPKKK
ncbi:hypothetical protein BLNAU_5211 [Blattamonas nauphoetae]|uniref:Uncharacterized protein n=1 Tax=Blattamonas nauphoetae TaxID=2049346 RepID=A0ABQ9Y7M1_9EUKA|nr:hypothetical protein BLNAU_5211 [Blattamonas nauphoetae]